MTIKCLSRIKYDEVHIPKSYTAAVVDDGHLHSNHWAIVLDSPLACQPKKINDSVHKFASGQIKDETFHFFLHPIFNWPDVLSTFTVELATIVTHLSQTHPI